jgi:hypothetical protein
MCNTVYLLPEPSSYLRVQLRAGRVSGLDARTYANAGTFRVAARVTESLAGDVIGLIAIHEVQFAFPPCLRVSGLALHPAAKRPTRRDTPMACYFARCICAIR